MSKIKNTISNSIPICFALLIVLFTIRIYQWMNEPSEYFGKAVETTYYLKGFALDVELTLIISTLGLLLAFLFQFIWKPLRFLPYILLCSTGILSNFILTVYYLKTKQPLSEEFYQLSSADITKAADIQSNLTIDIIGMIILLASLFVLLIYLFKKLTIGKWVMYPYLLLLVMSFVFYPSKSVKSSNYVADMVTNNKLSLFLAASETYYFESKPIASVVDLNTFKYLDDSFFQDPSQKTSEYPFLHDLSESSSLKEYIQPSPKGPPNIVIILVESLSSAFVGKNADQTGHLMPFLDSLSKKSLYFPNFISTCERTHNVLPAVLTSIPNAPDGVLLQNDEYPNHWSLMSLLSKHYYSRFYCGVDLSFSNMLGYMNYHKTDYLIRNWDKRFSTKMNGENYSWGHPDGHTFDQSWLDLNRMKIKKPRLDVFLTISTHDPFVIPNQQKYIERLKKSLKWNQNYRKDLQKVLDKADQFSCFVYTDDVLRDYFKKAAKSSDFDNTIYFIMGDHGSELCFKNELDKFKIPLIIYSPLQKKSGTFEVVNSHADITPTIINYLRSVYPQMELPDEAPFFGQDLVFEKQFSCKRTLPLITIACENNHLVYGNTFLYDDQLYQIRKDLKLKPIKNEKRSKFMHHQLRVFKKMANYLHYYNKVMPPSLYASGIEYEQQQTEYLATKYLTQVLTTKKEFIEIGDFQKVNLKWKTIEVDLLADMYLKDLKAFEKIPGLTVSIDDFNLKGNTNLFWKQVRPVLMSKFLANSWNRVHFNMHIRLQDLPKMSSNNELRYGLYNLLKQQWKLKNVKLTIYSSK